MIILNPVAFNVFGLDIRWYGIIISFGIIVALIVAYYTSKINGADYDEITSLALIVLPIAILGARLYYVVFEFDYYKNNLSQILNTRQGGLAIHGGLIFGIVTGIIYAKIKKLDFFQMADAVAPSIIIAQAIGRWGNFFNGEAHGGAVSEEFIKHFPSFIQKGMYIGGTYYHPTFLYESIWNLCICIILILLLKKISKNTCYKNFHGIILFSYIGLYSIGRFFIEGLRTDSLMLGPIRMAQLISISGILLWIVSLFYYKKYRTYK